MPILFWRTLSVVLSTQTFRQFIAAILFVTVLPIGLIVFGERVNWPLLPVFVAIGTAIGVGLDTHRMTFFRALVLSLISGAFLSLLVGVSVHLVEDTIGKAAHNLSLLATVELFAPLLAVLVLAMRWAARSEVHKAFIRGTARYNAEDIEKRRRIIDAFTHRNRT